MACSKQKTPCALSNGQEVLDLSDSEDKPILKESNATEKGITKPLAWPNAAKPIAYETK